MSKVRILLGDKVRIRRSKRTFKKPANQRQFSRTEVKYRVAIEVELHVPNGPGTHIDVSGETVNIGYGGALVCVDRELRVGIGCLVRFLGAKGMILPELRWGNIVRADTSDAGHLVAIEFDDPLELKVSDSCKLVELKELGSPRDR